MGGGGGGWNKQINYSDSYSRKVEDILSIVLISQLIPALIFLSYILTKKKSVYIVEN